MAPQRVTPHSFPSVELLDWNMAGGSVLISRHHESPHWLRFQTTAG